MAEQEKVPQSEILEIKGNAIKSLMDDTVNEETSNGSLSPDGYKKILDVAKILNVDLKINPQTEATLSKLRLYWNIEHEELPIINSAISLQKGEVCHYQNSSSWLEHRTLTKTVAYSGLTGSFKITKGVKYRVGLMKPKKISTDTLSEIDRGNLFLTNKRIIFMGNRKNSSIKYSSVLSIVPYLDGVGIEKDSGKSPVLLVNNADITAHLLSRLIRD